MDADHRRLNQIVVLPKSQNKYQLAYLNEYDHEFNESRRRGRVSIIILQFSKSYHG